MVSLYEYQRLAVNQLRNGTILCGSVGSGESRTSLAYFYMLIAIAEEELEQKYSDASMSAQSLIVSEPGDEGCPW